MPQTERISAVWMAAVSPARPQARVQRWLNWIAAVLVLTAPLWLYGFFRATDLYDPTASYFLVPLILVIAAALAWRVASRQLLLRRIMLVAVLAKFAAACALVYLAYAFYHMSADAVSYFYNGLLYASDVSWSGHWHLLRPFWSNNAVYMFTGALVAFLGAALQAISLIFAFISLAGQYFYYRAFVQASPQGDHLAAAVLLFLFPSLVFWPAEIGKDALIALALGLAVYGFALIVQRASLRAILLLTAGMVGTTIIRPHVAVMLAVAMTLPYALSRNRRGLTGIVARAFVAPALILCCFYLAYRAQDFLQMEKLSKATSVVQRVAAGNNVGGSAFSGNASLTARALAAPLLFFRPFPWEARSLQSGLAAGEGLLLLWLTWKRRRQLAATVRGWRENPFGAFLLLFVVEFCLVYSAAITNFGLLARERVMALPMLLMLLCLHAPARNPARQGPVTWRWAFTPTPGSR